MSQGQRTVLIVDDSPEDCELYREYLLQDRECQYTILIAESGRVGLELWQHHHSDVILLDYRLPDLDGVEFLAELQAMTRRSLLPVIVVIEVGNEAIAVQAMKTGAQNYLIKGKLTPEELQITVNSAIENLNLRTQLQQSLEKERLLTHITKQIYKSLNFNEIVQTVVRELQQFIKADRVLVLQLNSDGSGNVVAESVESPWRSILGLNIFPACLTNDYIERYRQGLVTAKTDIYDGTVDPCRVELLAQFQVRANLVIPIVRDNYFWGMLIVHNCRTPRQWQQFEIDLLQESGEHLSIALRQVEALEQLQNQLAEGKRAEVKLLESEGQLRLALKAAGMGTWDWNIVTGKVQWSANLEAFFGFEAGEYDGSWEMFINSVHPQDRDRVKEAVNAALIQGAEYNIEFRVVYPNGTIRWSLSQGKVFYNDFGQPVRMMGVDLDITERKQSEVELQENAAWLKLAQKATKSGLWDYDLAKGKAKISEEYCTLLDLDPSTKELGYEEWLSLIHSDDRTRISEYLDHMLHEQRQYYEIEFRTAHLEGERWLAGRAQIFYNEAGNPIRMIGNLQDISDRKQLQKEKELNELKSRFISMISHEFRTPLSTIISSSELLEHYRHKWSPEKQITHLRRIQVAVKRITEMLDDVLVLGKTEVTQLDVRPVPLDLIEYCQALVEELQLNAENQHKIAFSSEQQSVRCYMDKKLLGHILSNLLSNAIKYSQNADTIQFTFKSQPGQAIFEIQDQGIGIPAEDLPHLFESFYRGANVGNIPGTGLGLAIVKKCVDIYQGEIVVTSELGVGTTFRVTLPLIQIE